VPTRAAPTLWPISSGGPPESSHRDYHSQHGRHNSQTGQGIGHRAEGHGGLRRVLMVYFQIEIKHLIEIKSIDAGNGHAQGIANEGAHMLILDEGCVFGEDRTFLRLFDVILESHESIFARLVQEVIHHLERIDIGLLAEFRANENAADASCDFFQDVKRIGDQDGADGCAADDDQFRRLE